MCPDLCSLQPPQNRVASQGLALQQDILSVASVTLRTWAWSSVFLAHYIMNPAGLLWPHGSVFSLSLIRAAMPSWHSEGFHSTAMSFLYCTQYSRHLLAVHLHFYLHKHFFFLYFYLFILYKCVTSPSCFCSSSELCLFNIKTAFVCVNTEGSLMVLW